MESKATQGLQRCGAVDLFDALKRQEYGESFTRAEVVGWAASWASALAARRAADATPTPSADD